ncbi:protein starmaker-like [Hordeum vulgare subsp. vulgare]|nr:protein starmaker-like [Hordeum vulgare subsp. vulgare]
MRLIPQEDGQLHVIGCSSRRKWQRPARPPVSYQTWAITCSPPLFKYCFSLVASSANFSTHHCHPISMFMMRVELTPVRLLILLLLLIVVAAPLVSAMAPKEEIKEGAHREDLDDKISIASVDPDGYAAKEETKEKLLQGAHKEDLDDKLSIASVDPDAYAAVRKSVGPDSKKQVAKDVVDKTSYVMGALPEKKPEKSDGNKPEKSDDNKPEKKVMSLLKGETKNNVYEDAIAEKHAESKSKNKTNEEEEKKSKSKGDSSEYDGTEKKYKIKSDISEEDGSEKKEKKSKNKDDDEEEKEKNSKSKEEDSVYDTEEKPKNEDDNDEKKDKKSKNKDDDDDDDDNDDDDDDDDENQQKKEKKENKIKIKEDGDHDEKKEKKSKSKDDDDDKKKERKSKKENDSVAKKSKSKSESYETVDKKKSKGKNTTSHEDFDAVPTEAKANESMPVAGTPDGYQAPTMKTNSEMSTSDTPDGYQAPTMKTKSQLPAADMPDGYQASTTAQPKISAADTPDGYTVSTTQMSATDTPDGYIRPSKAQPTMSVTDSPDGNLPATDSPDGSLPATDSPDGSLPATDSPDGSVPATDSPDGYAASTKPKVDVQSYSEMVPQSVLRMLSPLVKSMCARTSYPYVCEASIARLPETAAVPARQKNLLGVLTLAIDAVRAKIVEAKNAATDVSKDPHVDKLSKGAISDCIGNYDDMNYQFDSALTALKRGDKATARSALDAARTDVDTCDNGFLDRPQLKPILGDYEKVLAQLSSNVLAINANAKY